MTPMKCNLDVAEAEREYTERAVGLLREMGMEERQKYFILLPALAAESCDCDVLACDPALIADEPTTALGP